MLKYTFYWLDGMCEVLEGHDPADALNRAGYGGGAVGALDFFAHGEDNAYVWSPEFHTWVPIAGVK